jgi:CBS domain-containing protein
MTTSDPAPPTVHPEMTLGEFMGERYDHRHFLYPVLLDDGRLGVLDIYDVERVPVDRWDAVRVRDCVKN